jgi:DNA-binding GntR family transcriptional regulator
VSEEATVAPDGKLPRVGKASMERAPGTGRRLALDVHAELREMIISGDLPPGAPVLQAEMARRLGVSRTPLREAFRLLQEEGLIENDPDQRAFVREIDPAELDSIYSSRIMLEAVGVSITVRTATAELVTRMTSALQDIRAHPVEEDAEQWRWAHREFHRLTTETAGAHLRNSIAALSETSDRFLRIAQLGHPGSWTRWDADHEKLVAAFQSRDHDTAVATIAQHIARTGLTAMADVAPHLDVPATRAALNLICGRHPSPA